jgi:2-oxoisovalerate dehydrogenase E1 component alpha subunit
MGHISAVAAADSETLAQKAIAAGFTGEQVDGNDVVAMRAAAKEAIAAARAGKGPRFIEAVTYRLGDHTTSDDASRYRSAEEVQAHWKEEPVTRLRAYLVGQKMWSKADEEQLAAPADRGTHRDEGAVGIGSGIDHRQTPMLVHK